MFKKFKDFFLQRPQVLIVVYVILAVIATIQSYYGGVKKFGTLPFDYTNYNNYQIFKYSFFHLKSGVDLYSSHPSEHWDLYKYSPTFALFFGFLAWLPDIAGLLIWNLLNALALFFGIRMLRLSTPEKGIILLLGMVELLTSLQNSQSNGLMAGLIILAFALMEKGKFFWACLCIAFTVYIKLFGVFAFAICLLYPQRWKMVGYSVLAMIGLAIIPLMMVSIDQLIIIYEQWWTLLQSDYVSNYLSLVGVVKAWSGISLPQNIVLLLGVILFVIPLVRIKFYTEPFFRMTFLAMILLWTVVFNHKAESPTFIIAVAGIGIWYVSSGLEVRLRNMLVILALVFTSLSTTDLFPNFIQDNFFEPWSVKAVPCIIIYFLTFYELTFRPNKFIKL